MLLEFQFLRPRANFGAYFTLEAYFDMYILYLVEKMLENLSKREEFGILKELKFSDRTL